MIPIDEKTTEQTEYQEFDEPDTVQHELVPFKRQTKLYDDDCRGCKDNNSGIPL